MAPPGGTPESVARHSSGTLTTLPPPADPGAIRVEVKATLLDGMFERSRASITTLVAVAALIRWCLAPAFAAEPWISRVFWPFLVLTVARLVMVWLPRTWWHRRFSTAAQTAAFATGACLTGLAVAALQVLAYPHLEPARAAVFAVIIAGITAMAIATLASHLWLYLAYVVPPTASLLACTLLDPRPPWGGDVLAAAAAIYLTALVAMARDHARTSWQATEFALRLRELALRDGLTELHNRRFLHEYMQTEFARLARTMRDAVASGETEPDIGAAVLLLDLDHFKPINDEHGHAAGDAVLRETAVLLTRTLRRSDLVVRWGGEEFVVVAPVRHRRDAHFVAERLRRLVAAHDYRLPDGQRIRLSCSIGVALLPFLPADPEALGWQSVVAVADGCMYLAKHEGRNRSVAAAPGPRPWVPLDAALAAVAESLSVAEAEGYVALTRGSPAAQGVPDPRPA